MALQQHTFAAQLACALLAGGMLGSVTLGARAQDVPASQIIKALTPAPLTRSLTGPSTPAMSPADRAFVDSLRGRTRSLTVGEGEHFAEIKKDQHLPNTDFEINFDFNSASITQQAESQLNEIGKALSSSDLKGSFFMVGGYTDAKGGADYNQNLSERRAEAVKHYLTDKFDIAAKDLDTVGYGKRHLKDPDDPFGGENRRVEIVNAESNSSPTLTPAVGSGRRSGRFCPIQL